MDDGSALPLAGGPAAFSLARLIDRRTGLARIVPVADIPGDWQTVMQRITDARPSWAGFSGSRPLVMGILNVTPDSFSDGGDFAAPDAAIAAGLAMVRAGADIIDIGGESTRPGATVIGPADEQARILPVIRALAPYAAISVDTRNAATMQAALVAGARIINDVSALTHDPAARRVAAEAHCPVVLMHMRGTPATMTALSRYADVACDVVEELEASITAAEAAGIARANIVVDPGIGFAKTADQSIAVMARLPLLFNLGCSVLLGASRKSFIGQAAGVQAPKDRLPGSLAVHGFAATVGVSAVRVHDVAETVQALRIISALTA